MECEILLKSFLIIFIITFTNMFSIDLSIGEKAWISKNRGGVYQVDSLRPLTIFLYKDSMGNFRGVQKDFFKYLEADTGIRFNFRYMDTKLLQESIKKNEATIVINASRTLERENCYTYLPTLNNYYIGFYTKDIKGINLNDIHEKTVGIIEGSTEEELFKKNYPKQYRNTKKIVYVVNSNDGFEKLNSGEIDTYLGKSSNDVFKVYSFHMLDKIAKKSIKMIVSKKEPELASIIQKYQKKFADKMFMNSLKVERPIFYKQLLMNDENIKCIQEKYKEIIVSMPAVDEIPSFFYKKNGKYFGYIPDRLEELSKILEIPVVLKPYKEGEDYNIKAVDYHLFEEKTEYFIPYYESNITLFSNIDSENLDLHEGLSGKKLGYVSHEKLNLDFKEVYGTEKVVRYNTNKEAFKAILERDIDVLMGDFKITSLSISRKHLDKKIKIIGFYNEKTNVGFGINPKDIYLAKTLKKILPNHTTAFHILSSHFEIYETPYIDYKYMFLVVVISSIIIFVMYFLLLRAQGEKYKAERITKALVESFEIANELNDEDTGNHILRVNLYSKLIAEMLGCSRKFIQEVSTYASLHDVGKIGISDVILKKPGKLTPEEFDEMQNHVVLGYKLIKKMQVGKIAENIALYHHEKYNGKGYSVGLKGEKIPLEARIVALADVYDALRQERVYKKGFSHQKAIEIIESERGEHFDPQVVDIFLKYNEKFDMIFKMN